MGRVYQDLRRLAAGQLRGERAEHTLRPTDLIHETFLRLADYQSLGWQDRAHFLAIAARTMRRILVDHARKRKAAKRGGSAIRVSLSEAGAATRTREVDLEALSEALERLEDLDPRQCQIVELRYFAGLRVKEIAEVLHVSPATVKRDWSVAKLWLRRELERLAS